MAQKLSVQKVKSMIGKQMEYALVDVREQEEFSKEHQLRVLKSIQHRLK